MKKVTLFFLLLFAGFKLFAGINEIDSLKQKLQLTTNDSLKAYVYTELANCYIKNEVYSGTQRWNFQNEAIRYTLLGLHFFSKYNDTTGLRMSFDNLAKVYHEQKKYSQAKWFILQSNALSRAKNDTHNIIVSLIELAVIKTEIKDYKLAALDLDEAFKIAAVNHDTQQAADVQRSFYYLYNRMGEYTKADEAQKKHDYLLDSMKTSEDAKVLEAMAIADSAVVKKKEPTPGSRLKKGKSLKKAGSHRS